ncbi:DUF308 domain-containing protein [Flavobacterium sp. M31R6]|uniref:HdeD family acid-resistance protein n=1 Tax=Flavobacterium sp. M31R6 TaxID=2739062 RepID=UPI001569F9D7|nr:DUF308 domain-containing protein [Flavobacterium sp. M31R6]QKJ64145.1 DUF308 domain-containing protein [Flavobacterium sp. M31R6]
METIIKSFSNVAKHWYLPLILGILFIICGIWAFRSPIGTYLALSILFSVSFIVSGIGDIAFAVVNVKTLKSWGWHLVSGLISFLLGIYLVAYPGLSMSILSFVVGFTLLFRSFLLLGFSFELKELGVKSWGWTTVMSVLCVLFCFMLLSNPIFTGLSIAMFTALSFIFSGIASIVLSFGLKRIKKSFKEMNAEIDNL